MEKPLLVSGTLIDPIKKGLKTQTRRLTGLGTINQDPDRYSFLHMVLEEPTGESYALFIDTTTNVSYTIKSPYGDSGGILWVRENYYFGKGYDGVKPKYVPAHAKIGFMSDGEKPEWAGKTHPGIHMPRTHCRILLDNKAVYCERLHDITETDAEAEGVECGTLLGDQLSFIKSSHEMPGVYRDGFHHVWNIINGSASWDANPWVWVVKFNLKK